MRKYLLATTAAMIMASPAVAKDNSGYIGIEGGVLFPKDPSGGKVLVDYSATQTPATPLAPVPADAVFNGVLGDLKSRRAVIDLTAFDLKGNKAKTQRHAINAIEKAGGRFRILEGKELRAKLPALKSVMSTSNSVTDSPADD